MERTIGTVARAAIAQIACVALLGPVPGLRLHAADLSDQGTNFNQVRSSTTAGRSPASTGTPTSTRTATSPIAAATEARGTNAKTEVVGRWDGTSVPLDVVCSTQCHGGFIDAADKEHGFHAVFAKNEQ